MTYVTFFCYNEINEPSAKHLEMQLTVEDRSNIHDITTIKICDRGSQPGLH
jgi:hypothetical protein